MNATLKELWEEFGIRVQQPGKHPEKLASQHYRWGTPVSEQISLRRDQSKGNNHVFLTFWLHINKPLNILH